MGNEDLFELASDFISLRLNLKYFKTSLETNIDDYTDAELMTYISRVRDIVTRFKNLKQTCFSIELDDEFEGFYINQTMVNNEFKKNSIVCTNELELYVMNLENLILQLAHKDSYNHPILYSFESHSITAYFIKLLERMGLINIKHLEKDYGKLNMQDVALFFLNNKDKYTPSYFVSFELTDLKIDANVLMSINEELGIEKETYIYNEKLGVFEYNRKYQKRKIINNTFYARKKSQGIIRNFDKNITVWNLPFQIVKKEANYFIGQCLYEASEVTTKVLEKVFER